MAGFGGTSPLEFGFPDSMDWNLDRSLIRNPDWPKIRYMFMNSVEPKNMKMGHSKTSGKSFKSGNRISANLIFSDFVGGYDKNPDL